MLAIIQHCSLVDSKPDAATKKSCSFKQTKPQCPLSFGSCWIHLDTHTDTSITWTWALMKPSPPVTHLRKATLLIQHLQHTPWGLHNTTKQHLSLLHSKPLQTRQKQPPHHISRVPSQIRLEITVPAGWALNTNN